MKRIALVAALFAAVALRPDARVHAQPASALGQGLPKPDLGTGTVSVRVIAGTTSSPVTGADVTLLVDNVPRVMRTDASGRAMFTGLPVNAQVQAKIVDEQQKDVLSAPFAVPDQGGMAVMLTTRPYTGGAGTPNEGGMGGMPSARAASGQPQIDADLPGGSYQLRLTYDNVSLGSGKPTDPAAPVGAMASIVGYSYDNGVVLKQQAIDATGVARFDGLDVSGGTVYYALGTLPRGDVWDRMMAMPISLTSQGGSKVILSGEKRDSGAPPVDDLRTPAAIETPAGKVRVTLDGVVQEASPVRLIDASTKLEVGRAVPTRPPPDLGMTETQSQFVPQSDAPAGTIRVDIHGGPGGEDKQLANLAIKLVPLSAGTPVPGANTGNQQHGNAPVSGGADAAPAGSAAGSGSATVATSAGPQATGSAGSAAATPALAEAPPAAATGVTDANGRAVLTVPPGEYKLVYTINGRDFQTPPFDVTKQGGTIEAVANWPTEGRYEVLFDLVPRPNQVLYAEAIHKNFLYRSLPFQPIPTAGTHVSIVVYPPALFTFSLRALMDDEQLAVRGTFSIEHRSWIPYRASPDGMIIPLPKGFKGAVIAPESQDAVTVAPGEGFRILRPIPPGGIKFVAGFSLDAEDGDVQWNLDLPMGTFQSGIEIRRAPGMSVKGLPPNTNTRVVPAENGTEWIVVFPVSISRNRSMQMTIAGVPAHPAWKKWVPRIVGAGALVIMLGGVGYAIATRKRSGAVAGATRKQQLLDELVELERSGSDPQRKEAIMAELERLWTD